VLRVRLWLSRLCPSLLSKLEAEPDGDQTNSKSEHPYGGVRRVRCLMSAGWKPTPTGHGKCHHNTENSQDLYSYPTHSIDHCATLLRFQSRARGGSPQLRSAEAPVATVEAVSISVIDQFPALAQTWRQRLPRRKRQRLLTRDSRASEQIRPGAESRRRRRDRQRGERDAVRLDDVFLFPGG
jgi:hypothetical protein